MGYTKEQLISRLQELKIDFSKYEHPVVMTVEAQAKFVGHLQGALSKNLFLKDKKHRYYVVSALAETKVDLKVLSQRLGLGKGGLRMAPEEALGEILQVPLGSVTPLALVNESARHVSLLLDQGFKTQESCFFHPLSNDMTISLKARDLDKFLNSIGKEPAYVDLEANPSVGKDQPPDLASLVPADVTVVPSEKITLPTTQKPEAPTDKTIKPSSNLTKQKPTSVAKVSSLYTDPEKFVEEMLEKATSIVLSEIKEENVKLYGNELGAVVSNKIKKQLSTELKNMAMIFKNTAYTEGFHAGSYCQLKRV